MKILVRIILSFSLLFSLACSSRYYARKGDKLFDKGLYYQSESKYAKAYKKSKDKNFKSNVAFKAGLTLEKINENRKASSWYKRAVRQRDSFPEALVQLVQVEIKSGKIEEAVDQFAVYKDCVPESDRGSEERLAQVLERAKEWRANPQAYIVRPMDKLNSRDSEFSPMYFNGDTTTIIFASTRKKDQKRRAKIDVVTGDKYSNLYRCDYTNQITRDVRNKRGRVIDTKTITVDEFDWQKPVSLGDSVNSSFNEGAACFNPENSLLYFTSSRKIQKKGYGTKIYSAAMQDDEWGSLNKLDFISDSLSVGHPAFSPDGKTLYFASDMDGGFGGNDIWMVEFKNGKWGNPVNLGPNVNTGKEEVFPYVRENGMLYFSSDRYDGMGGLDLYVAKPRGNVWDVSNLKFPINSEADDFSIVFQPGEDKGLFASSRNRGNDDIYSFEKMKVDGFLLGTLEGKISFDEGLEGKKIDLKVVSSKGQEIYVDLDEKGNFKLPVYANTKYTVTVSGEDFLTEKKVIEARGTGQKVDVDLNFELKGVGVPIRLKNVLFGFNEWQLSATAKSALNDLVKTIKEHSDIRIELSSHTDYVGSEALNDSISNLRAQACVEYLVAQGVDGSRLKALSFGESKPWVVKQEGQDKYPFLKVGDVLTKAFIDKLSSEKEKEVAMQMNRRTEIKIERIEAGKSKKRDRFGR